MRPFKAATLAASAILIGATASVAASSSPVPGRIMRPKAPLSAMPAKLVGELREGVECPLIEASDGRRFALVGDLRGHPIGERVCVAGEPLAVSVCMQGPAMRVKRIGSPADCD